MLQIITLSSILNFGPFFFGLKLHQTNNPKSQSLQFFLLRYSLMKTNETAGGGAYEKPVSKKLPYAQRIRDNFLLMRQSVSRGGSYITTLHYGHAKNNAYALLHFDVANLVE